ncbi:MAG TPA: hypothetical protein VGF86_15815 [Candidatus Tumulicola sp.]
MSSALVVRIVAPVLAAAALACGGAAWAKSASLEDMLAGQLIAADVPAMLGPITSAGRKGWECKPERAASAQGSQAAELPPDPESP